MKKVLSLVIVLALALSCTAALADTLLFATQESGTAGYNYATAIKTVIEANVDGVTVSLTADSDGNVTSPYLIENGAADIVLSNAAPAMWAFNEGIESAGVPQTPSICCIAGGLGNDFVNVMFTQRFVDETGITTVEDLVATETPVKLVIKKNGSFGELAAERVFAVLGIDINNPPAWLEVTKTGGSQIKDGLADDTYDMTVDHIGAGQANTTELCLTHDMYDVQLGEDTMAALCEQGFGYVTVPANTWNGQDTEIKTVGSQQCILVSADMDEELAYNITKALCENKESLAEASSVLGYFNPEVAGTMTYTGCNLHPGAARYYQEMNYAVE